MESNRSADPFFNSDLALSVATVPVLALLVTGQAIVKTVQDLGMMSEEIFRGDRLPPIEFSESSFSEESR